MCVQLNGIWSQFISNLDNNAAFQTDFTSSFTETLQQFLFTGLADNFNDQPPAAASKHAWDKNVYEY